MLTQHSYRYIWVYPKKPQSTHRQIKHLVRNTEFWCIFAFSSVKLQAVNRQQSSVVKNFQVNAHGVRRFCVPESESSALLRAVSPLNGT